MENKTKNVLIIGDLHCPFEIPNYLKFCKLVYKKYKCNKVIFIGDIIDSHASSFHESDPDGYSAGDELYHAKKHLKEWYKAFPKADVILGNHCRIVARKAMSAGLSKHWVRSLREVLELPNWSFHTKIVLDGVLYIHGEGVTARTKALRVGKSVVQGHRHTEGYVWHNQTYGCANFGMQVGTGIDIESYAFAYAKDHPDPIISCGVVLENGTMPIFIPMKS